MGISNGIVYDGGWFTSDGGMVRRRLVVIGADGSLRWRSKPVLSAHSLRTTL